MLPMKIELTNLVGLGFPARISKAPPPLVAVLALPTNAQFMNNELSSCNQTAPRGEELPAIVFAYRKNNLDSKGHIGLIRSYKNEDLKLTGNLQENKIALSFVEIETEEIINLKPLPCNPQQIEIFLKNKYNRISILWGLVHPENGKDLIIPTPDDGSPPSQLIIKGFELL